MQTTLSLNGTWQVVFDPDNSGRARGYGGADELPEGAAVPVPGVWELARPGYDGAGWYTRAFELPEGADGKVVRLRFGAVNYFCEVWLNGSYAGSHEGGYTPFTLDVTDAVRPGVNRLTVRVIDPPRDHAVDGFVNAAPLRQTDLPVWKAGWYHNFGGIWQDVALLVTERTYVDDLFVQASCVRKKIDAAITIVNRGEARPATLLVSAQPADGRGEALFSDRMSFGLEHGANTLSVSHALANFVPWDCDNPFLYDLEAILVDGEVELHRHSVRFGIRDFEVRDGNFLLNGKRIVLKGFLQQGVYPVTLVFPHTREMALKEMRLLTDNGFNYIRAHLKPTPPAILDLADEMGILISAEPPMGWMLATEAGARRAEREVREFVLRDRNRPSVIFWCLFNEISDDVTLGLKRRELMKLTHTLDPTRLVVGNSGAVGSQGGQTECYRPYETELSGFTAAGAYYGASQQGLTRFRTAGQAGVPALISEFGAMEAPMQYRDVLAHYTDEQKQQGLEDYAQYKSYYDSLCDIFARGGLSRIWADPEALIDEIDVMRGREARLEVSNIRVNPHWQGYAYCQLADASGEIFGATDLWREPKRIFHGVTEASRVPWVTPVVDPRCVRPGEVVTLQTWVINEDRTGVDYDVTIEVKTPGGDVLRTFRESVAARTWADRLADRTITAPDQPGRYVVTAYVRDGQQPICSNSMTFTVLPEPSAGPRDVAVWDLTGKLPDALAALGLRAEKVGNNYRRKDRVTVFAMNADLHPVLVQEYLGAARRIVKAGGVLVLLEQAWPLFWWYLLERPIRRQAVMRNCVYTLDHPVFRGLPAKGIMDDEYLPVQARHFHDPYDIYANGGDIVSGTLFAHMWTTPDIYYWGSCLDVIPLGDGHIITCTLRLLGNDAPIARNLAANLVDYAQTLIRPGNEEDLWAGRCIDAW